MYIYSKGQLPYCFFYTPGAQDPNILSQMPKHECVTFFDLEDGVPLYDKEKARASIYSIFEENSNYFRGVRINPLYDPECMKDILLLNSLKVSPDIVILAMTSHGEEGRLLNQLLIDKSIRLFASVESPRSILEIDGIGRNFHGLAFGSGDYAAFLAAEITWENMLHARFKIVTTALNYEIPAMDSVSFILDDLQGLERECIALRSMGYYGKGAPHPMHINIINHHFGNSAEVVEESENILKKSKENGGKIFRLGDKMIGPPTVRKAEAVLLRSSGKRQ